MVTLAHILRDESNVYYMYECTSCAAVGPRWRALTTSPPGKESARIPLHLASNIIHSQLFCF